MPYSGEKINQPLLRELMNKHELKANDVADLLDRKLTTVQTWMAASGVDIPDHSLQLLEYKLNESTA